MDIEANDLKEFKLQPMKCELNFLSKSDGSALLSQGETVTLVSINGPLDIKTQSQNIEKSTLEVLFYAKVGNPSVQDRYKEHIIKQTCEVAVLGSLYPRTGITITVQELEDYGGLVSCALNCTCLALINTGLALNHVFAAVSCAVDEMGNILLEPTREQAANARALLTFVFESRKKDLVTSLSEGSYSEAAYEEAMERCRAASDLVFKFYRDIVTQYSKLI